MPHVHVPVCRLTFTRLHLPCNLSETLSSPCQEHTLFLVNYLPLFFSASHSAARGCRLSPAAGETRGPTWWMIPVALQLHVSRADRTERSAGRCPNLWSVSTEGGSTANATTVTFTARGNKGGIIIVAFLMVNGSHNATCFVRQIYSETISHSKVQWSLSSI